MAMMVESGDHGRRAAASAPAAAWTSSLFDLVAAAPVKTVAVVGLVKNAGKTTVANALMEHVPLRWGLTSLGLDGERTDHLTGLAKPSIVPPAGTLVATTEGSLDRSRYRMDVIEELPFRTALGRVVIGVAGCTAGAVEVSGPTTLSEVRTTVDRLLGLGAERVLVDGAINRLGSASPRVSDGLIMATGGMTGDTLGEAVECTAQTLQMLMLPQVDATTRQLLCAPGDDGAGRPSCRLVSLDVRDQATPLDLETAVGEGAAVCREIRRLGTRTLYCGGALTQDFIDDVIRVLPPRQDLRLVVRDATVLVTPPAWVSRLLRRGIRIEVLDPLRVLAVTTNPFRLPQPLNATVFFRAIVDAVGERVPVFDVVGGLAHVPAAAVANAGRARPARPAGQAPGADLKEGDG